MISSSEKDVKLHQANRANNLFIAWVDLQELEKLSQKFEENDLDATNKGETFIVEKREIEGRVASYCLVAQTEVSTALCFCILIT